MQGGLVRRWIAEPRGRRGVLGVTLRIGLVSDVHMRSEYRTELTTELSRVADAFDRFDPHLVVALGDIVEDETQRVDYEHVELVRDRLSFGPPLRMLAGNHDVVNISPRTLGSLFGAGLDGVSRIGGETLVFLNSAAPRLGDARGEVSNSGLRTLSELSGDEPLTVFVHHPIHYRNLEESAWWSTCPERAFCGNKRNVNGLLDDLSVRCVLNGHLHDTDHTRYRGVDHVTIGAFSKRTPNEPVTGTHAEIELGERVRVESKVGSETVAVYEL